MTEPGRDDGRDDDGRDTVPPVDLVACVRSAVAAPSLHNSQPWRFRIRAGGVDVLADPSRQLAVLDPAGRELLISVGAALFNLRLAMRGQARVPALGCFRIRRNRVWSPGSCRARPPRPTRRCTRWPRRFPSGTPTAGRSRAR